MGHATTALRCTAILTVFVSLGLGIGWVFPEKRWVAWLFATLASVCLIPLRAYRQAGGSLAGIMRACRSRWFLLALAAFVVPCLAVGAWLHVKTDSSNPPMIWATASLIAGCLWPLPMMLIIRMKRRSRLHAPLSTEGDFADLYRRITGKEHPTLKGELSERYKKFLERNPEFPKRET